MTDNLSSQNYKLNNTIQQSWTVKTSPEHSFRDTLSPHYLHDYSLYHDIKERDIFRKSIDQSIYQRKVHKENKKKFVSFSAFTAIAATIFILIKKSIK